MVTTRRQEALQMMNTPPSGWEQTEGEPSPSTPVDAALPSRLPLKSALKTRLLPGDGRHGEECTPVDAGLKKTVRIHSSNNMVHEFQASLTTDDAHAYSDDEGGATPESGRRRRPPPRRRPATPRYDKFMSGVLAGMRSSGGGSNGGSTGGGAADGGALLGLLFTLSWMLASSALIFVNKTLMVDHGFRFPFALTSMGQMSSMLLAWLASVVGVAPLRPAPSWEVAFSKLLPVSFSFAASLFLGNVAYLGMSVAFINIMKAATPMVTLAVGLALRLERTSKLTLAATVLIAVGTAISTSSEASSGHFRWLSFFAFALSVVFEGIRVVLTEKLLGQAKYNVMEALVYLGPFTLAFLGGGAYLFEWDQGLSTEGMRVMRERPFDFAVATLISFQVNLFCYLAIKYVSATSFKVAGCLKNVLVVWGGVLQGDVVTPQELQGYAVSLVGFVLFSASKLRGTVPGAGQTGDSQSPAKKQR